MSKTVELAEKSSGESPPVWLAEAWTHYRKKQEFHVMTADWIAKYADLVALINESKERGEIDAIPSRGELDMPGHVPSFYQIIVKPDALRLLESHPLRVHRQKTVNGEKVDMRSEWGLALARGDISSLCGAARMLLDDLAGAEDLATRTRIRIKLTHLVACHGSAIKARDPALYMRMVAPRPLVSERAGSE